MRRCGLFVVVLLLYTGAALRDGLDQWIDTTELPLVLAETSIEVRDRSGALLRAYMVEDGIWRLNVREEDVDPTFVKMLISFEDKRFYRHTGVDPLAMLRATVQALWSQKIVSGGSTLTMQVARLLENSGTGGWAGKLRQIRVALALERKLNKQAILSLYLIHAPYGGNLEGVRAGALAWFGKEPTRLTPAQSALLIALPQAPERRRPDRYATEARAARDRVLSRLADVIGIDVARDAANAPVPEAQRAFPQYAAHLGDRAIASDPTTSLHDLTIDIHLQSSIESLAKNAVRGHDPRLSTAIVVADYTTGDILASVGSPFYDGADGRQGFVNMTTAIRSPGSTLKPLIYALAFDRGLAHPETLIDDRPVAFGRYAPQNFDGQFRGQIRVRDALQLSLNIPVVLLTDDIGPAHIMAALRRAGAEPQVPGGKPGLAIALGGLGMSLEELVQLYGGLANGGQSIDLKWRSQARPFDSVPITTDVAAWHIGHILSGLAPPPGAPRGRLAYKTGTSYGHRDAWAIGYDGQHVIGVWMGRADGTPVPGAFGANLAAPVMFEAFGRLKPTLSLLPAPPPATLMVQTADLPQPLQVFRGRHAVFEKPADAPQLAFPPDGAVLQQSDQPLTLRLSRGVPPFTVFANGAPAGTGVFTRQVAIPRPGRGFSSISIVDAKGRSDQIEIRID